MTDYIALSPNVVIARVVLGPTWAYVATGQPIAAPPAPAPAQLGLL